MVDMFGTYRTHACADDSMHRVGADCCPFDATGSIRPGCEGDVIDRAGAPVLQVTEDFSLVLVG